MVENEPETSSSDSDEIAHLFCCCDENTAMCGADITGQTKYANASDIVCILCDDDWDECPRCGDDGSGIVCRTHGDNCPYL